MANTNQNWLAWWHEAEANAQLAGELINTARWSFAIYHALMAMELASKAMRMVNPSLGDLEQATLGELEKYTLGQLTHGLEPRVHGNNHELRNLLDAPWLDGLGRSALMALDQLTRHLPGHPQELYLACRYPDQWPAGSPAPHAIFQKSHADATVQSMKQFLDACSERLKVRGLLV